MAEQFEVKVTESRQIYIHNTLENAVYHLKRKIEERIQNDQREGVGLEIMACLTMIAFSFEAQVNFLGFKLDEKWAERKPYLVKMERIARKLKVPLDQSTRPYSTIKTLKTFRDTLAHGKPQLIKGEKNLVLTHEELLLQSIISSSGEPSGASVVEVGRMSKVCGMRCEAIAPGLSEPTIDRLRLASLSEFAGVSPTSMGSESKAISATRHGRSGPDIWSTYTNPTMNSTTSILFMSYS
jgi:hypothetical protein